MASSYVETNGDGFHASSNGGGLLTVAQVAKILNAHPHSVRRWSDSGLLPCYRIGLRGDRRFDPADIDEFLVHRKNGHPVEQSTDTDRESLDDHIDFPDHKVLESRGP